MGLLLMKCVYFFSLFFNCSGIRLYLVMLKAFLVFPCKNEILISKFPLRDPVKWSFLIL